MDVPVDRGQHKLHMCSAGMKIHRSGRATCSNDFGPLVIRVASGFGPQRVP